MLWHESQINVLITNGTDYEECMLVVTTSTFGFITDSKGDLGVVDQLRYKGQSILKSSKCGFLS